jgi:hypothetical protein
MTVPTFGFVAIVTAVAVICVTADQGQAVITKCIPPILGNEPLRRNQVWEYQAGHIKQPSFPDLCLTVTTAMLVQGAPDVEMLPCSTDPKIAANQTWGLSAYGQITQRGKCIDVAGYNKSPGAKLHLWACTPLSPLPFPPGPSSTNQQWIWTPDGAVHSLMNNFCLSARNQSNIPKTCELPPWNTSKFCDTSLSPEQRAAALVAETNLTEHIENLVVGGPGFPEHGVPSPRFGEALHGVCGSCGKTFTSNSSTGGEYTSTGCATSFPHATAMASTFNRSLWHAMGDVIGREGRAMHNQHISGSTFFAPNINLVRIVVPIVLVGKRE